MNFLETSWVNISSGFGVALTPENLMFGIFGIVLGTAVGVLPGLGPAVAISLLLPMTFGLDPIAAFIMFGGIYYGAMYGGATTAILLNTPGSASAVVSTFDGHPMAKKGKAGTALLAAIWGSFIGGTFATLMLMLLAPTLVELALFFGPPEYFSLMLFALLLIVLVGGASRAKSIFATLLGLALAVIGIDLQTGTSRFTFGIPELASGVDVVLASIGLFAVGEVLWIACGGDQNDGNMNSTNRKLSITGKELGRASAAWFRGSVIGFFVGILPGTGGPLATFMAYGTERSLSKHPEKFGTGIVEGVAAPEAANNASAGGSMVPLLALGIPGSATTAVMLVAFQIYGLQPGPLLFENSGDLVWGLIASLYIANLLLVLINLPLIGMWVRLLSIPQGILYASVLVFSTLGAFSLKSSLIDVLIVYCLGVMAFILRRLQIPIAPVLLGIVLGPMIEQEFRRSMAISSGDYSLFVTRPISLCIIILMVILILTTGLRLLRTKKRS